MGNAVFSVDSVSAGYGMKSVLKNISFMVGAGEFISLVGPNGAGKSTIIRALSGSIPAAGGRIKFYGREIGGYSIRELASMMSLVISFTGEMPDFTVKLFLSMGRFPHRKQFAPDPMEESIVADTAAMCGVTHLLKRSIKELSTGELQIVQIARALIQNSGVLLLDEPVSNLDYRHLVEIMGILSSLKKNGATIICALHDVNTAIEYSTRLIAVKEGTVFFDGSPVEAVSEESISGLYDTKFYCGKNPVTGLPLVYPVPGPH